MKPNSTVLLGSLNTEFVTVAYMVERYCKDHHLAKGADKTTQTEPQWQSAMNLCAECSELLAYAETRLDRCPYGEQKPACNTCPIHCYKPEPKDQMRQVMRYSGPRMLLQHPLLAFRHLWLEKQTVPELNKQMIPNRKKRKM
jgi:hypothetical protein